jgi:hypothetical protein
MSVEATTSRDGGGHGSRGPNRQNTLKIQILRQRDGSSCSFTHCHTILYYIHIMGDDRDSRAGSLESLSSVDTRRSQIYGQRAGRWRPLTTTSYTIYINTRSIATPIGEDNTPLGDSTRSPRIGEHSVVVIIWTYIILDYNLSW